MNQRIFGKTGRSITEIGLGTWQLGTVWGDPFNEAEATKILESAYDCGINMIDTADIYNDGNSELAIGSFIKKHPDHFYIVTKCGRALDPHVAEGYNAENIEKFIDGSLSRMGLERLDMILLHCPPTSVYSIFNAIPAGTRKEIFSYPEGIHATSTKMPGADAYEATVGEK